MSRRYIPAAAALVAALTVSAPAAAAPPPGACPHGCPAYAATQAFKAYVYKHTVPPGDSFATFGFAGFGCSGIGHRRYECEVTSATCRVSGVVAVVEGKPGGHTAFAGPRSSGDCPKWRDQTPTAAKERPLQREPCPPLNFPTGGPVPTGLVGLLYAAGGPYPPFECPLEGQLLVEEVPSTARVEVNPVTSLVTFPTGPVVARVTVGRGGRFEIPLKPGTYMVSAELVGRAYPLQEGPFTVVAGQQTRALIQDAIS